MFNQLATLILAAANGNAVMLLLAVAVATAAALIKVLTGRPREGSQSKHRRAGTPSAFSYWYALVPFEHEIGCKDRPVLVLHLEGPNAKVLKVTSRDKTGRTNWRRIDTSRWDRPGQRQGSWLQTDKATTVPLANFRRCLGHETNIYFRRELLRIHPTASDQPEADPSGTAQP